MRINVGEHRVHEDVVRSGRVRYFKINVVSARPTEMNGRYRLDTVVGGVLGGAPIGTEVAWGGRHCRYFLQYCNGKCACMLKKKRLCMPFEPVCVLGLFATHVLLSMLPISADILKGRHFYLV